MSVVFRIANINNKTFNKRTKTRQRCSPYTTSGLVASSTGSRLEVDNMFAVAVYLSVVWMILLLRIRLLSIGWLSLWMLLCCCVAPMSVVYIRGRPVSWIYVCVCLHCMRACVRARVCVCMRCVSIARVSWIGRSSSCCDTHTHTHSYSYALLCWLFRYKRSSTRMYAVIVSHTFHRLHTLHVVVCGCWTQCVHSLIWDIFIALSLFSPYVRTYGTYDMRACGCQLNNLKNDLNFIPIAMKE